MSNSDLNTKFVKNNIMTKRVITLIIGAAILIGIPYLFGRGWLFLSWIPAIFAMLYLDDE